VDTVNYAAGAWYQQLLKQDNGSDKKKTAFDDGGLIPIATSGFLRLRLARDNWGMQFQRKIPLKSFGFFLNVRKTF